MNITPTVDLLEVIVLILGIIGLSVSVTMLFIIQGDRNNVRISGLNGINKRLANADLRNELSRTYKLLGFTVTAALSMMVPPSIRTENQIAGDIFKWLLVSWEVVAVINSVWSFVDRIQNREALHELNELKAAEAAARTLERETNVLVAATNASDAAANAADSQANSEDALANASDASANAANTAAYAAKLARDEVRETGKEKGEVNEPDPS